MNRETDHLRSWASLQGLVVVNLEDGKKIGTIDDFLFDPRTNKIHAFQIKTGIFSQKLLPIDVVQAIGQDAVTITEDRDLKKEPPQDDASHWAHGKTLNNYHILSESGTTVGNLQTVFIEAMTPSDLSIGAYELAAGLTQKLRGKSKSFLAKEVIRYGEDVIFIPDAIAQKLL